MAFIGATLSIAKSFDNFCRSMGTDTKSRLSNIIEPIRHGKISVEAQTDDDPVDVIAAAERPCLVVTPSHDLSRVLGEQLPDAIVRQPDETTSEAALRMPQDGILIAAGAWAGLDLAQMLGSSFVRTEGSILCTGTVALADGLNRRSIGLRAPALGGCLRMIRLCGLPWHHLTDEETDE